MHSTIAITMSNYQVLMGSVIQHYITSVVANFMLAW